MNDALAKYSNELKKLLWEHPAIARFFRDMECGWMDGGCHTLARALYRHFIESGHEASFVGIFDEYACEGECSTCHVAVKIGNYYVDANGIQDASELMDTWRERLGETLILEDVCSANDLALLEYDVPSFYEVTEPLIMLLQEMGPMPA